MSRQLMKEWIARLEWSTEPTKGLGKGELKVDREAAK